VHWAHKILICAHVLEIPKNPERNVPVSHCKGAADIFLQNPGCKVHCCSQWRSIPTIKYKPFYMYAPSILRVDFQIKGAFLQCHVIDVTQEQYCVVRETRYVHGEHQRLSASHWLIFITIQQGVHLYRRAVRAVLVTRSLVLCVLFCRSFSVLFRILITPLVSSSSS
jgi:hypothetical protein